jgi:hypothetical protein
MIRRQARFLGKPVRALAVRNDSAVLPKARKEIKFLRHMHGLRTVADNQPTPSAFSFRCSAERSMPTNSAVREILPEKRLIWAIR